MNSIIQLYENISAIFYFFEIKLVFSKKATKNGKIFTVNLTLTTYCQIGSEDFVNFCGLLRKHELLYKFLLELALDHLTSEKNNILIISHRMTDATKIILSHCHCENNELIIKKPDYGGCRRIQT